MRYSIHTHVYSIQICICIYIYSHPGVDRIADIFKKDFQKKKIVGISLKPSVFTRFSSLLSHF